jgi:sRNA-binding regulator protein Hfq
MTNEINDWKAKENEIKRLTFEFFKKENAKVHIELNNGRFYNGKVLEVAGDMIIFDDSILGAMPIYFHLISVVEKYIERKAE